MKLQDLLKDIELGKVYTDKDRKPFKVNEDHHDKKGKKYSMQSAFDGGKGVAVTDYLGSERTYQTLPLSKVKKIVIEGNLTEASFTKKRDFGNQKYWTVTKSFLITFSKVLRLYTPSPVR